MSDETGEREECGHCDHANCTCCGDNCIPAVAPCICDIQALMRGGCTCGAMDAERGKP